MKTIRLRTVLVSAGIVAMACDGKLLLDKGKGSSMANDGGVDASAGGSNSPPPSNGGRSGGSGGSAGRPEIGGAMNAAGGAMNAAGGAMNAAGGAMNTAGGAMNTAGGAMNTAGGAIGVGGSFPLGSGGTLPLYPDCPGSGSGGIGIGGFMQYLLPATTSHWKGNAADCPSVAPASGSACTVAYGETCIYESSTPDDAGVPGWYVCIAKDATHNAWFNISPGTGPASCPAVQPAEGQNCVPDPNDRFMFGCSYPGAECHCGQNDTTTWHCIDGIPKKLAPLPADLDASKRVVDLSEDERRTWCEWYDCNIVYSRSQPQVDGDYTVSADCEGWQDPFTNAILAQLPLPMCIGNLRVSTCQATLQDLTDCAATFGRSWPTGAGCARYFTSPGCSGTIGVADDQNYKGARGGAQGVVGGSSGMGVAGPGPIFDCSVRIQ